MFLGEYQHSVDEKGRIAIPVKFRAALQKGAVITRGIDHCLFVYPIKEWEALAAKLAALPVSQANTRAFARLMLAGAMEVTPDRQGRVILPDYLRRYGKLSRNVVLAGLYNRLELWDATTWENYRKGTEKNGAAIAEAMHDLGV
ncbi:cell division/cell wall cluster transcriptional repressor MraZ [Candidatus Uhrbacteria bacterium CG10_big_fil_rev_8_21_14_0_10_48_11]|uniref:Transcriptional regulator MraZ n=1 Tax=Candidatus Uhrbacteria bacterium CG10_big_fil_rev_8_21_14_0_10_48_11 TaxID=1975037 RepID=A0A2M8LDF1_9BACT|nr:MAG: cell division/cell wall cluster transcriptional repressor MraZ [Candidatus Uhrbacteria bacterium CG10_big_fil_rev_8_21_14_0_10_48_11]